MGIIITHMSYIAGALCLLALTLIITASIGLWWLSDYHSMGFYVALWVLGFIVLVVSMFMLGSSKSKVYRYG